MVRVPLMFLSEWREFPSAPCLAGKKNLKTAHVSMLLKSRASPDMFPFFLCNKERPAIRAHEQTPLSNNTIDSVLRHREIGWAKDLSAPPRIFIPRKIIPLQYFSRASVSLYSYGDVGFIVTKVLTENSNLHSHRSKYL